MEALELPNGPLPRVPRRTPKACKQCRTAKIKCSGSRPCARCTRRRDSCVFPSDEPHVSVPERYLRHLQLRLSAAQAASLPQSDMTSHNDTDASASVASPAAPAAALPAPADHDQRSPLPSSGGNPPSSSTPRVDCEPSASSPCPPQQCVPHNPLVSRDLSYVQEAGGRPRYLGPTSTWSFCRRALSLLERHSPTSEAAPLNTDGTAFRLRWTPEAQVELAHVKDLPPKQFSDHLLHTAKFHLGELFALVDEEEFDSNLGIYYRNTLQTAQENKLWFITYLILLAFGKAFLGFGYSAVPSGSQYAARALALLPDPAYMHENPIPSIQVLALVALYLQSIDMRSSAYQYIGQALRLCYIEGIHQHVADEVVDPRFSRRCASLWWGVYVLDQEITANQGCPSAVPEAVVTVPLPDKTSSSLPAKALTLRIALSRLTARMCSTVYGLNEGLSQDFVKSTTSILQQLADVSSELDSTISSSNQNRRSDLPHVFRHITLSYHHCVILATRPLVMWLLISRIESSPINPQQLPGPIAALLKVSADSAAIIVVMLQTLADHDMLECFLPFQLDYVFAAAMLLSIIETVLPAYAPDANWARSVGFIFEKMIAKNNVVARLRQSEIQQLHFLLLSLHANGPMPPPHGDNEQSLTSASSIGANLQEMRFLANENMNTDNNLIDLGWDSFPGIEQIMFNQSDQMLELVDQFQLGELNQSILLEPSI